MAASRSAIYRQSLVYGSLGYADRLVLECNQEPRKGGCGDHPRSGRSAQATNYRLVFNDHSPFLALAIAAHSHAERVTDCAQASLRMRCRPSTSGCGHATAKFSFRPYRHYPNGNHHMDALTAICAIRGASLQHCSCRFQSICHAGACPYGAVPRRPCFSRGNG
jgi:hypothetical protein